MSDDRPKTEYQIAVEEFEKADAKYKEAEEEFLNGTTLTSIVALTKGGPDELKAAWRQAIEEIKNLLQDRNSKLTTAKNSLRGTVQISSLQERGHDGKPTVSHEGPFTVSSVTYRSFEADDLMNLCKKNKVLDELLTLKKMDKAGKEVRLVRQEWEIDYEGVRNWLLSKSLNTILTAAYAEKEGTPQVKGPKKLAFLGDRVEEK